MADFVKLITADIGLYRGCYNANITGMLPSDVNNYAQYQQNMSPFPLSYTVQPYSADVGLTEIPEGEDRNLCGFMLKINGVFTHKYAVCRAHGWVVRPFDTNHGEERGYMIQWYLYDELLGTYTEISEYSTDCFVGQLGSVKWSNVMAKFIFHAEKRNFRGVEQNVIYAGIYLEGQAPSTVTDPKYASIALQGIGVSSNLQGYDPIDIEGVLWNPDFGPESDPGGYGPGSGTSGGSGGPGPTFDATSDPFVVYPNKPGVAALGLVNLYKCDVGSLVNLGAELFPDIHWPTSLQDVGEVLAAVSDSIWNSKLIDYIISAHIIPVDVTGGNLVDIKVGTRTMTGILARPIADDVVEFDCGTLHIDEFYTNYVDYMTRCRLYLPFYGMIDIKPEYWQSADLQVKYLFNVIDGSFVAQVFSTVTRHQKPFTAMVGQYTGCACVHVPMTGASYASMFGGMISGAAGMAAGVATMNPALAVTSAVNAAASSAGNMESGGSYNASAGFYGYPCPYLIIERPVSHFSARYNTEKGMPLLVSKQIGNCRGFTVAEDIILDGIPCTSDEKERIRNYFKTGVIIR